MKKLRNDYEFCEKLCMLEGEIAMIEDELKYNKHPFQRKEHQSLLYEKRKQLSKTLEKYNKFIKHNKD